MHRGLHWAIRAAGLAGICTLSILALSRGSAPGASRAGRANPAPLTADGRVTPLPSMLNRAVSRRAASTAALGESAADPGALVAPSAPEPDRAAAVQDLLNAVLETDDPGSALAALHALAALQGEAVERALAAVANDPTLPVRVRREALLLLSAKPGEVAYGTCTALLDSDEPSLRLGASQALGVLGRGEALGALSDQLFAESSPGISRAIVQAMGRLGTPQAVEALLGYSANLPVGLTRDEVLGALAGVSDPAALSALMTAAQVSGDVESRRAVVTALARIADPGSFDVLLGRLQGDPDSVVRCQAMQGLGLIGDARALPALWILHASVDPSERSYAWTAIQRIQPGATGPP